MPEYQCFCFYKNDQLSVNSNHWLFGDGGSDTNKICNHSYLYPDTFVVKLISTNQFNCMDSFEKYVIIYPSPISIFTINDSTQCLKANSFSFTNNSNFKSPSGSWFWDYFDGNFDTTKNPVHNFTSTGNFDIKLVSTNQFNCKDSIIKQITVLPSPVSTFTINDSVQCLKGNAFVFNCTQTAVSYLWHIGDGNTNSGSSFNHSYLTPDTFKVNLKVGECIWLYGFGGEECICKSFSRCHIFSK